MSSNDAVQPIVTADNSEDERDANRETVSTGRSDRTKKSNKTSKGKSKGAYKKSVAITHCGLCADVDEDNMVQCDDCDTWFHFRCVDVSGGIAERDWICNKCEQAKDPVDPAVHEPSNNHLVRKEQDSAERELHLLSQPANVMSDASMLSPLAAEMQKLKLPNPSGARTRSNLDESKLPYEKTSKSASVAVSRTSGCMDVAGALGTKPPTLVGSQGSKLSRQRNLELELRKLEEAKMLKLKQIQKEVEIERDFLDSKYELLMDSASQVDDEQSEVSKFTTKIKLWIDEVNQNQKEPLDSSRHDHADRMRGVESGRLVQQQGAIPSERGADEIPPSRHRFPVGRAYGGQSVPSDPRRQDQREIRDSRLTAENLRDLEDVERQRNQHEEFEVRRTNSVYVNQPPRFFPRQRSTPNEHIHLQMQRQSAIDYENEAFGTLNRSQLAARQAVPKDLPDFSGNIEDWPLFYSMFNSSSQMCGFTNEENMLRLRKCLKGRALEAVRCRLLHPSNVVGAISTLKMLYGKPEAIIHAIIRKIRAMPPPNLERLETVVNFALSVENLCATIEACNLNEYIYNASLRYELIDKLPSSLKLDWSKFSRDTPTPKLSDFGHWLYSIAEDASNVMMPEVHVKTRVRKDDRFLNIHSDSPHSPDAGGINQHESDEENNPSVCIVCKGSCISVAKCGRFTEFTSDSKWAAVRELRLCRKCLRSHYGSCRQQKVCGVNGCSYKHHPLLHTEKRQQNPSSGHVAQPSDRDNAQSCNVHQIQTSDTLFRIIPVTLHGKNKQIETFAFLDDGSELTLMEDDLIDQLEMHSTTRPLCLKWTGNTRRYEDRSRCVDLEISGAGKPSEKFPLSEVRTVRELNLPRQTLLMDQMREKYPYLKGLPIESYSLAKPKILIGLDHASLGHALKGREGAPNQPVAVKTRLGWIAYGSCSGVKPAYSYVNCHIVHTGRCDCQTEEDLHQLVKEYFSLDSMGVVKMDKQLISVNDARAQSMLQSLTRRRGERFMTGLLWKYDDVRLPESRAMALKRTECLERRLQKDQQLAEALRAKLTEYEIKGYIRKLSTSELEEPQNRIWYLPIFPVSNPNKPGKIRVVWDAAATSHGISLNAMLLKGPDQLTSLTSVLLQFRQFKVGICGDLREMFLQLELIPQDRQCLRFFFRTNPADPHPSVYVTNVMPFGTACSPSCAQYVKNLNALEHQEVYPAAANAIIRWHYVDDMLTSIESEDEAVRLACDVKTVHKNGGFEMRNWKSNSEKVLSAMNERRHENGMSLDLGSEMATEKVLGLWWCTTSDFFTFKLSNRHNPELLSGQRIPTKRELLRMLMLIYDPLGFIAHVLMYLKVLLQDVWRAAVQWDEPIPDTLFQKWLTWLKVLPQLEEVRIPRCFRTQTSTNPSTIIQMHTFVDGGENGFAAVVFLRFEEMGHVECSLVCAKTRVAPLKFLSTPRCELQAAVLGVRLSNSVSEALSITVSKRYFWTDSRNLLCWLNSDHRRYSQYVGCRIGEILETSDVTSWRYVPSKQNVADDGTKWDRIPDLSTNSRWFIGPGFLGKPEQEWPQVPFSIVPIQLELRPHQLSHHVNNEKVISTERYSTWERAKRVAAFVNRFIRNMRSKICKQVKATGPFRQLEIAEAENLLYREAQMECYADEYSLLRNQSEQTPIKVPKNSRIFRVSPFIDSVGVMRSRTRIQACEYADPQTKNPVILPPEHPTTRLIMQHYHAQYNHINHTSAINKIRLHYYISRLNASFRNIRSKCQRCKIDRAKPIPPQMADLPVARLAAFTRPFSYIGIDYFGPLTVLVGRRSEKRWGVLITCLTVRAVHIEIAHTLNTASCVMALRRFMSRRGTPLEIFSDCGTNFKGAAKEQHAVLGNIDQDQLASEFFNANITWNFIPPGSPHMGGAWERLVQTVKRNLHQMKLPRLPTDEVLNSALVEIENIINSRPLTHVPVDDELAFVLTPNHFLVGSTSGLKPATNCDDTASALKQSWELSQSMANFFWKHWLSDYLPCITRRSKWFEPAKPIEEGDIVVIADPQLPRNVWPKGKVISTTRSKDGQVRRATIQTASGIYERPAVKVAVLDVGVRRSTLQEDLPSTAEGTVMCADSIDPPCAEVGSCQ